MAAQMTSLGQLLSSAPEAAEENAEGKKSLWECWERILAASVMLRSSAVGSYRTEMYFSSVIKGSTLLMWDCAEKDE